MTTYTNESLENTNMELRCLANAQYWRRECLDVIYISTEEYADILDEKVPNIFGKLRCDITPELIEACHRISKNSSKVIVKFTRRRRLSANLECNFLLIEAKVLRWKRKKLHSSGKIFSFYISGDTIKIKVMENSSSFSVTHVDYFGKYFPHTQCAKRHLQDV